MVKWIVVAMGAVVVGAAAAIIFYVSEYPDTLAKEMQRLHRAAEQGQANAQYNLGYLYAHGAHGEGVPKDGAAAVRWFRLAAEQGLTEAHTALGIMYVQGEGIPRDLVNGYAWLIVAAAQGEKNAKMVKETVAGLLTESQIAEARRRSEVYRMRYVDQQP